MYSRNLVQSMTEANSSLVPEKLTEKVMLAPSVAIPMIVVKRPLKNVMTESPLCLAIG